MDAVLIAADWVSGLLFAGVIGMVAFGSQELSLARLLVILAAAIAAVRWTVWAFTTDSHWGYRLTVGAIIGGFLFTAIPAAVSWIDGRQSALAETERQKGADKKTPPGPPPAVQAGIPHQQQPAPTLPMPKLFSLFMHDLQPSVGAEWDCFTDYELTINGKTAKVRVFYKVFDDFNANAKFMSVYLPEIRIKGEPAPDLAILILSGFAAKHAQFLKDVESVWAVVRGSGDSEAVSTKDIPFSGRIYVYNANDLTTEQLGDLAKTFKAHGVSPLFRGMDYALAAWSAIRAGDTKPPPEYEVRNGQPVLVQSHGQPPTVFHATQTTTESKVQKHHVLGGSPTHSATNPPSQSHETIYAPDNQGIVTQGQTGGTNTVNQSPPDDSGPRQKP